MDFNFIQDPEWNKYNPEAKAKILATAFRRDVASDKEWSKYSPDSQQTIWETYYEKAGEFEQSLMPTPEEPSLIKTAGRGLAHGTLGVAESVGIGAQWLGKRIGSKPVAQAGEIASEYWGEKAEAFGPPESIEGKNVWDDPSLLADANYWIYNIPDMLPALGASMAAMLAMPEVAVPANASKALVLLAKIGKYIPTMVVGGGLEATQTYKSVLDAGGSEESAARSAELMGLGAGVLNAIGTGKILSKAAGASFKARVLKTFGAGGWEGLTEGLEEPTEVLSKYLGKYLSGEELPDNLVEQLFESLKEAATVAPIAAVTGMGGSVIRGQEATKEDAGTKPPSEATDLIASIDEGMTTGEALGQPFTPELALDIIKQAHEDKIITDKDLDNFAEKYPELKNGIIGEKISSEITQEMQAAEKPTSARDILGAEDVTAKELLTGKKESSEIAIENQRRIDAIAPEYLNPPEPAELPSGLIKTPKGIVQKEFFEREREILESSKLDPEETVRFAGINRAKELVKTHPDLFTLVRTIEDNIELMTPEEAKQLPSGQGFIIKPETKLRKTPTPKPYEADVSYKPMLSKSGKPFKTMGMANRVLEKRGLSKTEYTIVEHEGGYAIQRFGRKVKGLEPISTEPTAEIAREPVSVEKKPVEFIGMQERINKPPIPLVNELDTKSTVAYDPAKHEMTNLPEYEKALKPVKEVAPEKAEVGKEPWEMGSSAFSKQKEGNPFWEKHYPTMGDAAYLHDTQKYHEKAVKQAISEGKSVPAKILAEYSDLAPAKPPTPKPAKPTKPEAVTEDFEGKGIAEVGAVSPKLLERQKSVAQKIESLRNRIDQAEKTAMPGTFVTGRENVPRSRIRKLESQLDKRIDSAVEYEKLKTELKSIESQIKSQEEAPKRELIKEKVKVELEKQFDTIKVGDQIDVGGNNILTVIKKNPKSVKTETGGTWKAEEILKVIPKKEKAEVTPEKVEVETTPEGKEISKLTLTKRYVKETGEKIEEDEIGKVKEKYPKEWEAADKAEKYKESFWNKMPKDFRYNRGINEYTTEELEEMVAFQGISQKTWENLTLKEFEKIPLPIRNDLSKKYPLLPKVIQEERAEAGRWAEEHDRKIREGKAKKAKPAEKPAGEKKFATKATKPQDTITRKDLRQIFSKMKNITTGQDKEGNFYFKAFNKPKVTIYEVNNIEGYIDTSSGRIPVGSYLKDKIELKTGGKGRTAGVATALHEFTHYLEMNNLLSGNDITALNRAIAKVKGISEDMVSEEHRADFVGDNIAEWQGQKNLRIKRILKKISDFMNAVYEFVAKTSVGQRIGMEERTAKGVLRDIESGKILAGEKEAVGINQFAQDVSFSLKKAVKAVTDNPNFVKWFGDSKVLDEKGKPLIVFHGTADPIHIFEPSERGRTTTSESAKKGFFFTSNKKVAQGYAEFARPKKIDSLKSEYERLEKIAQKAGTNKAWDIYDKAYAKYENAELSYVRDSGAAKENVVEAYLSIKNPLIHDYDGVEFRDESYSDLIDEAIKSGNDGVVFKNTYDGVGEHGTIENPLIDVYVAFKPTQIKSIFNTGAYGLTEPDIRYQMADKESKKFSTKFSSDYKEMLREYRKEHTTDYIKTIEKYESKLKSAETKLEKIKTAKDILQRRRTKIKAFRDYFNLTDAELRQISRKDIRLMSNYEFKQYVDGIKLKAEKFDERRQAINELTFHIREKELNIENLRKAMKLPTLKNMTVKQIQMLDKELEPFQKGDVFLSVRKLETVDRTELKGIKTWREARERLAKKLNVPIRELQNIRVSEYDRFRYDTGLAERNPFYKMMVEESAKRMLVSESEYLKIEQDVFTLAKQTKGRKFLIPQYKKIREFMEAPSDKKAEIDMAEEELALANYMTRHFSDAMDYLLQIEAMKMGRENYFTHVRRGILEAVKEDGIIKAVKEQFVAYKLDEQAFNILDRETGEILAMDKFFKFAMRRTGELKPTENIVKAFLTYMRTFKKKQALDEITPLIDIYAHALTPKGMTKKGLLLHGNLIKFVREWVNTQKGRHITLLAKQNGKIDAALRTIKMFTSLRDLAFNIPVSIATEVGEQITTYQLLGKRKFFLGKKRQNTKQGKKIIEKYRNLIGKNPWKELAEPSKAIGDRLMEGIFILFRDASARANKTFLLGSLSKFEFESGIVFSGRLTALRTELGRYRMVAGMKSIIGATPEGKAYTQYKRWAIPILRTTIQNLGILGKKITFQKPNSEAFKKSAIEVYRLAEITAFAMLVFGMVRDEDDDSFVGKIINKAYREATTLIQALQPSMFLTAGRTASFVEKLGTNLTLILQGEEYKTTGEYKGIKKLKRQFTPVAISQFSGGGIDDYWDRRLRKHKSKLNSIKDKFDRAKNKAAFRRKHSKELSELRSVNRLQGRLNEHRKRINRIKSRAETKANKLRIQRLEKERTEMIKRHLGK